MCCAPPCPPPALLLQSCKCMTQIPSSTGTCWPSHGHAGRQVPPAALCGARTAKPPHMDRSGTLCLCMELLEALLWYFGVTLAANFDQLWAVLAAPPASRPQQAHCQPLPGPAAAGAHRRAQCLAWRRQPLVFQQSTRWLLRLRRRSTTAGSCWRLWTSLAREGAVGLGAGRSQPPGGCGRAGFAQRAALCRRPRVIQACAAQPPPRDYMRTALVHLGTATDQLRASGAVLATAAQ